MKKALPSLYKMIRPARVVLRLTSKSNNNPLLTQCKHKATVATPTQTPNESAKTDGTKFSPQMQMYASRLNTRNREEYERAKKVKNFNKILGVALGAFCLSVYGYTMFAISQEKFLDDFDVPEPPDPGYKEAMNKTRK